MGGGEYGRCALFPLNSSRIIVAPKGRADAPFPPSRGHNAASGLSRLWSPPEFEELRADSPVRLWDLLSLRTNA